MSFSFVTPLIKKVRSLFRSVPSYHIECALSEMETDQGQGQYHGLLGLSRRPSNFDQEQVMMRLLGETPADALRRIKGIDLGVLVGDLGCSNIIEQLTGNRSKAVKCSKDGSAHSVQI